jgi:hypothetical protein
VTVRRLVVVLLVLVAVLAVLDRVGAKAAERAVAEQVQQDQQLAVRPDVSINGFPFMTQLVAGDYDEVDVTVHDIGAAGFVHVARLTAHLHGARVPLGDVINQDVDRIPVDRATAEVVIDFGALNEFLAGKSVRLSAAEGSKVHVAATVAGAEVDADVPVTIEPDALVLTLPGGVDVRLPMPDLPFGVRLQAVQVDGEGLVVTGSARDFALRA